MGVLLGIVTMAVVAYSNSLTSVLLLRAAGLTGHDSYEGVAYAIGGKGWKVLTQVALILLLFGTVIGDFALLADVGQRALTRLTPGHAPAILAEHDGRGIMVLLVLLVVFPLCLLKRMRSLEAAAQAGVVIVGALAAIIAAEAARSGFPAIRSGELPLWGLKAGGDLPEAFAVLGFAFYVQPMLMPLLHELPPGPASVSLTATAVRIVVIGVASLVYGVIGIFGAARYGDKTQGNILVNRWLGGPAEGVLDLAIAAYLSISVPPMQMSCRYTLDVLIAGEDAPFDRRRHLVETCLIVFGSLAVALAFPTGAEKIFAVTGATAVCIVCYVIPVALHLKLYLSKSGYQLLEAAESPSLAEPLLQGTQEGEAKALAEQLEALQDSIGDIMNGVEAPCSASEEGQGRAQSGSPRRDSSRLSFRKAKECLEELVLPMLVVVLGVGFSLAALYVSLASAIWPDMSPEPDRTRTVLADAYNRTTLCCTES
ncbi:hypothetical protein CVIRNUC_001976 [Coccomyxa viridis]|uniref:Amino acid transporter transmembrane domain-containing protein n=1 Tax=Coccomyxa viridis TaxID=1274662 RepID=A0AAV1HY41_9CHLO|nr:hypothetical protein CVIRNUC_001976 [Coccomyxa viridis]